MEDFGVWPSDGSKIGFVEQRGELPGAWSVDTLEKPIMPVGGQRERFVWVDLGRDIANKNSDSEILVND